MDAHRVPWTPDSFATQCERRGDGTLLLRPRVALGEFPLCLTDMLEHWAQRAPERLLVAERGPDGSWRSLTYAGMLERVQRVAASLHARGLCAERPLVILSGNGIEHLVLALGAMWSGVPYCPVSPNYSLLSTDFGRLRAVFELLTPGLVAAFDVRAFAPAMAAVARDLDVVSSLAALESAATSEVAQAHAAVDADTIAKFLLTSGSTGQPKAVVTTHRMLCSNALMVRQALPFLAAEPPVLVDWLPWNHTFGGSHNVGIVLLNGGSLYIDDGKPTDTGIEHTIRNLREISPTVYFNVPKGFDMLAPRLQQDPVLRRSFYRRLQACFFAGASLAQRTWDALDLAAVQERGDKVPMLSGLGATETGPSVTFTTPAMGRSGVIGLPANGTLVKLAPLGPKLEIRVRSPGVTPGYWRQPDLSAAAFDEEGFYRLGDAVRLLDSADPTRGLLFDGRLGEDFKLASGTWVSVGPLRADLIAALSPLAQDVVIAGADEAFVAVLIVADLQACAGLFGLAHLPSRLDLAGSTIAHAWVRERLVALAKRNPSSSRCIRRALLLPSALSMDEGEVTDKGSVNQRAVLKCQGKYVAELYATMPPPHVITIE